MSSESNPDPQTSLRELGKKLWAANRLHVNLDGAVYKHAVIGLGEIRRALIETDLVECMV